MSNNIRKESTKNKFMMNKEKINFIPYWDFLKLIPSYKGSKEALLLAFLIDEDGKDYNRHPETPSLFKCSRSMMCEAVNVSLTAIDRYLDNLQFWGFIKYEAIQLPKSPVCTYIELQGDLIEKLAIYYNKLIEEKKYDEITSISSCDRYVYRNKIDTYIITIQTSISSCDNSSIITIQTPISSCDNSNNSINNTTNNSSKRENPTPMSSLEPEKDYVDTSLVKKITKSDADILEIGEYKNVIITRAWSKAALAKYGDKKTTISHLHKLDYYLEENPDQKDWALNRGLDKFLEYLERAIKMYGTSADWQYPIKSKGYATGL